MKLSKFAYLLITCILMLSFWNVRPIVALLNRDTIFVITLAWAAAGFFLFKDVQNLPVVFFKKYRCILILIFAGIFLSMFNSYLFREQGIITTFIAQRFTYTFIILASLAYVQPTLRDIIKALRIVSYITLLAWIASAVSPHFFFNISEETLRLKASTDIGFTVVGIQIVTLYTYYLIYKYVKHFTVKDFLTAFFWIGFIFLYQNRSMMIGVIVAFVYSLTKLKSRYKLFIILGISSAACVFIFYTWQIWVSLIAETDSQLGNKDYNRWKALNYYLTDYSPNIWCYLFGNGMPAGSFSELGRLYWYNFSRGIYTSDIGMIGMWAHYGILPLIGIYFVLIKILFGKRFPLWLKFMSLHICIVPTIFHFSNASGILTFVLVIYLYMYYCELPHFRMYYSYINKYACRHYCKLQE